jgi:hypothetical protein
MTERKLFPHQQRALEVIGAGASGVVKNFCGTGKTQIIYERLRQVRAIAAVVYPSGWECQFEVESPGRELWKARRTSCSCPTIWSNF